jgi:hypothetical protein
MENSEGYDLVVRKDSGILTGVNAALEIFVGEE